MIVYDVELRGEVWCIQRGTDDPVPITEAGKPARPAEGWRPIRMISGLGPLDVLEFRHAGGQAAIWFLNPDWSFKTNVFEKLSETERAGFFEAVVGPARNVWQQLVVAPAPALDAETRGFLLFGTQTLREVARLGGDELFPRPRALRLDNPDDAEVFAKDRRFQPGGINVAITAELFKRDFLRDAIRAATFGRLILPSPFDGRSLASDISYPLTTMTIAYKFTDPGHDVTFYAVASLWCATLVAYFFPSFDLVLFENLRNANHLSSLLGQPLDKALFDHAIRYGTELEAYLRAPHRTVAYDYFQDHLGHHLWNELSGLHSVATELPREQMPPILMVSGARSEMYGRVDELMPELAGKVDRTPLSRDELIRSVYAKHYCLFNATGDYVSADLARRVVTLAEQSPRVVSAKAEAARLAAEGFVIVMLGLRVENRTVVDPASFFAFVTGVLREQCKRVAVVLDGHNSDAEAGTVYPSHAENLAKQSPDEVEHGVVKHVREKFAGDPNVTVISTVGAPVAASIFWCRRAAFFVTPWGAGLAKYRWICNQRGLVTAGERFFRYAGPMTVHLYDTPEYMEAPTPLDFISPDDVTDDPAAPLLIGIADDHNRINYRVKPEAVRDRLAKLVRDLGVAA